MRIYTLKIRKPDWYYEEPTDDQITALKFFKAEIPNNIDQGTAGGMLNNLLQIDKNREAWEQEAKKQDRKTVIELLKQGSLFNTPTPTLSFEGAAIVFTGQFESATRNECVATAELLKASSARGNVSKNTDYLIVGKKGCANWAEGNFGRKMEKAMLLRLDYGKPSIICESDWLKAVQETSPDAAEAFS